MSKLTITELKLFLREPALVFFALALPPLVLVILGCVPAFREPSPDLGGARVIDLYVPVAIAMAIAMTALGAVPLALATYREKGILRRMATTPVHPIRLLTAQLVVSAALAAGMLVLVVVIGRLAFAVELPRQILGYVLAFGLTTVAMLALGLLIAALAPNGKAASAIGNVMFFPLAFCAGLYFPRAAMPDVLRQISDFTPLGAGVSAMDTTAAGSWPSLQAIGVMLIWTLAAGALAARYFRWEGGAR